MNDILLESGTNELEVLEFKVGDQTFGINVAKITEVMSYQLVTTIPSADEAFEGVFVPRDKVISVIDLHKVLKRERPADTNGMLIICHFNKLDVAFHVTSICGIQRISWDSIEKPPEMSGNEANSLATGIAKIKNDLVLILDFEQIVSKLNATAVLDNSNVQKRETTDKHIVIAEDSIMLNTLIVKSLNDAGYTNVSHFPNGKDAWDYLQSVSDPSTISCVISDIEMPQMDGHHLTKLIKSDSKLNKVPVFLFSSLINEQMYQKGLSVGADEQFSKPQIGMLIERLMQILSE